MYHDVIPTDESDSSGFPGQGVAIYKPNPETFQSHLEAIYETGNTPPELINGESLNKKADRSWMITFDDGGVSAYTYIAPLLETYHLKTHFFL